MSQRIISQDTRIDRYSKREITTYTVYQTFIYEPVGLEESSYKTGNVAGGIRAYKFAVSRGREHWFRVTKSAASGRGGTTTFEVSRNMSTFTVTRDNSSDFELSVKYAITHSALGYRLLRISGGSDTYYDINEPEDILEAFDAFDIAIFLHHLQTGDSGFDFSLPSASPIPEGMEGNLTTQRIVAARSMDVPDI
ncbi:uncharacterized protein LY89DRAFT_666436 [Mollisia scopiformis]|uniref:Uncharacterized protein n=1 Tax=Mollisia scopiformis TaxID=149040 RepID=A0A194XKQ5_MOLSC|nr:uncharacterized protein LY89DRAFT_666436 [Mollisia scopiformis]KUJ20800.1 hypothetical protein LY89DRAFT_666436 [Mollisia scopiformis]